MTQYAPAFPMVLPAKVSEIPLASIFEMNFASVAKVESELASLSPAVKSERVDGELVENEISHRLKTSNFGSRHFPVLTHYEGPFNKNIV